MPILSARPLPAKTKSNKTKSNEVWLRRWLFIGMVGWLAPLSAAQAQFGKEFETEGFASEPTPPAASTPPSSAPSAQPPASGSATASGSAPTSGTTASGSAQSGSLQLGGSASTSTGAQAGGTATGASSAADSTSAAGVATNDDATTYANPYRTEASEDEMLRAQRFRRQQTLHGSTGGLHVLDADSAAAETFRLQLALRGFSARDVLIEGDHNGYFGATLAFSWTILDFLETYASIHSHANFNDREDPQLFQVLGDTVVGVKGWYHALPWLALGADVRMAFLNSVGDIGLVMSGTSFGLRGNVSADFRRLPTPAPLIARFNLDYFFDNSGNLIQGVEEARYRNLLDPNPNMGLESRHLLTRIERFALGIQRTDMLTVALGLEAPLEVSEDFFIQPLVEWQIGVPVNRQGYVCLYLPNDPDEDSCLEREGLSAIPSILTLGLRVLPPVKGLSFLAAADIGVSGTSTIVRELAATPPYMLTFGLAYAYDTRPPPPVVQRVEVVRDVTAPEPIRGRVLGRVVEQGANTPIAGARVDYVERELTPQQSTEAGTFVSYLLEPGEVRLDIRHPEYQQTSCAVEIPEQGGDAELTCTMVALPRVGGLAGRVMGEGGNAIAGASVHVTGPASRSLTTDGSGTFNVEELPPGQYTARVEADDYLIKLQDFTVVARETARPEIALMPKPKQPLVRVNPREIIIRRQINFVTDSAEIDEVSAPLLSEIADVLLRNPQIRLVEIQGHTDNRGARQHNLDLSQARADSVKRWLVGAGVETSRLETQGYGPDRPIVPNLTNANRARNRRVQFMIKEQGP